MISKLAGPHRSGATPSSPSSPSPSSRSFNLTHWHEFLQCLERAGFRGEKMIFSDNSIVFSYALWVIGRVDYQVPVDRLRELIARWFFMAHTTGRYTSSPESALESDLKRIADIPEHNGAAFVEETLFR